MSDVVTRDLGQTAPLGARRGGPNIVSLPPDNDALQNDIRLLDGLLDATILRLNGEASLALVEGDSRGGTATAQRTVARRGPPAARPLRCRLNCPSYAR